MTQPFDEPWRIELFGRLRATRAGREITRFKSRKAGLLLGYLACHLDRAHPREMLIELLWPECEPSAGRQRLNQLLSSLRRQFEPPGVPPGAVILSERDWVRLNPAAVRTDAAEFQEALQAARRAAAPAERMPRLIHAVELYSGQLLTGYSETWIVGEQAQFAATHLAALRELVTLLEQAADWPRAIHHVSRALQFDPLDEALQQELIRLLAASGQPAAALRQFEDWERRLSRELGAQPAPPTRALAEQIRRQLREGGLLPERSPVEIPRGRFGTTAAPPDPATRAALPPPGYPGPEPRAPLGSLPLRLTRFFGREVEIAQLCEAVGHRPSTAGDDGPVLTDSRWPTADGPRLLTLTGTGGSGKTRLAAEVAERLQAGWQGAVWFVSLLDVADPHLIPDKLVTVLRLSRAAHIDPLDQAAAFLCRQPAFLVMDNFEHLIDGGTDVLVRLLERLPALTVLVTSRQRLGIPGEQETTLAPLPVPAEGVGSGRTDFAGPYTPHPTPYTLSQCPSVALFVDRAQAVKPDFQLTARNAADIAALCRGLEGLPLALELAAARAGVLSPSQMLARLEQPFELLVGRQRSSDPRHRSLRATLEWSYQLLPPVAQRFFTRLSVFRGGWTIAAAESVGSEPQALEVLDHLRQCSLIEAEETDVRCSVFEVGRDAPEHRSPGANRRTTEIRFRLLETLREYGHELLDPAEQAALERRHAEYYTAMAEEASGHRYGPDQEFWFERLEREHDNLRAVLEHCLRCADRSAALRPLPALLWIWRTRCHLSEGRSWIDRVLALPGERCPMSAEGQALQGAGLLAYHQSDFTAARRLFERSLLMGQDLGNQSLTGFVLYDLAVLAITEEKWEEALSRLEQCRQIFTSIGERRGMGMVLHMLGVVAFQGGDLATAGHRLQEALLLIREAGDGLGIAHTARWLGRALYLQGDAAGGQRLLEEARDICQAKGFPHELGRALFCLGEMWLHRNNVEPAQRYVEEALRMFRELGLRQDITMALASLAEIERRHGNLVAARTLLEERVAVHRAIGNPNGIAEASQQVALLALEQGDAAAAREALRESLRWRRPPGRHPGLVDCLEGLARIDAEAAQVPPDGKLSPVAGDAWRRAVHLLGAAAALRAALALPLGAMDAPLSALRSVLGAADFAAAWEAGQRLSEDHAVAIALDEALLPTQEAVQQIRADGRSRPGEPRPTPRADLTPAEWTAILPLLPPTAGRRGRPFEEHRRVINGIFWKLRTGAAWRDLPARYGPWHTCHERYRRWRRQGLWDRVEQALNSPSDPQEE